MIELLPHVNATLNSLAGLLLIFGFIAIRQKKEAAHKFLMISAFAVSSAFLVCYLVYHKLAGHRPLPPTVQGPIRMAYLVMLASHIVLAALVPFMAIAAIILGYMDRRKAHRRLVRFAFPIWLYVSITGVLIYCTLYWCFPV